jgi:tRNA(Ile)-lysidine synthase
LSAIHQQVRRTIRRHALVPTGARVLAAVSGGSDSVALAWVLRELSDSGDLDLAGLAHLNHQLRPAADRDEQFCRDLAKRLGVPIDVGTRDVKGFAAAERLSLEDAARRARYAWLEETADRRGAAWIAVGHTQDDQAETFLFKLVRGAGATGLGGIYPSRGRIVRPLLDLTRADLRGFLAERGECWVEDETNADLRNPRNLLRHVILPGLEEALGLPARRAMARAAGLMAEDARWLDELAARRFDEVAFATGPGLELDADALRGDPLPVARRVVLKALRCQSPGREIGLDHVQAAMDVLSGAATAAEVPGSRVELRGGKLVLVQQKVASASTT